MFFPQRNKSPSQTGSTQKLNLVIMAAVSFIALVVLIAWIALGMMQEKIQHVIDHFVKMNLLGENIQGSGFAEPNAGANSRSTVRILISAPFGLFRAVFPGITPARSGTKS